MMSRKVYSVRQANSPNMCGQVFCKMGHMVSHQGPNGVRKQYHNELSENKVMEGKIGEAFEDGNFGLFSFMEGTFLHLLNVLILSWSVLWILSLHWCLLMAALPPVPQPLLTSFFSSHLFSVLLKLFLSGCTPGLAACQLLDSTKSTNQRN